MKKLFLSILFLAAFLISNSQTDSTAKDPILKVGEVMPTYPGGDEARAKFIQRNLHFPEAELKAGTTGTTYVTFVVEKDGSVTDVRTLKGIPNGEGLDKEAVRIVKLMPNWNPGTQNGKPVRIQFNMPIKFSSRTPVANPK